MIALFNPAAWGTTTTTNLISLIETHHAKTSAEWLGKIEEQLKKIAQKVG